MLLQRDVHTAMVMLPSRKDDREMLRDDMDYFKIKNTVRYMMREGVKDD